MQDCHSKVQDLELSSKKNVKIKPGVQSDQGYILKPLSAGEQRINCDKASGSQELIEVIAIIQDKCLNVQGVWAMTVEVKGCGSNGDTFRRQNGQDDVMDWMMN